MNAVGQVESGGRYTARNPISGAYGKYQIMPSNWPSWARTLPRQRERQADARQPGEGRRRASSRSLYQLARQLAPRRLLVADRLERGRPAGPTTPRATSTGSWPATSRPAGTRPARPPTGSTEALHASELERDRLHRHVEGRRARRLRRRPRPLRDRGRRHRDVHVHRHAGRLVRPGRPDPRQGQGLHRRQVRQDGRPASHASFDAQRRRLQQSWTTTGAHTLTIEVVGTRGHPMVAHRRVPSSATAEGGAALSGSPGPRSRPGSPRRARSPRPSPASAARSGRTRGRPCSSPPNSLKSRR